MSGTRSTTGAHDYIVVGAGSAGAVLAARLTEDPAVSVLLLEAGPEAEADEISIPAAFPALFKTKWDWNYDTTEQKQLHNRRAFWPRMKALGGCSSMNAMIYIRGNAADYDSWRDEYGAAGWGYDDVLPYFRKAEGNTRLGGTYHGQDGPLHVEDRRYTHELTNFWVESAVSAGMKPTDDFNGSEQEGAGLYQVTCRNGRRWSVNEAYLKPVRDRDNLDVETGAFATRIVVEQDRATGVTYRLGGREITATATREVLLCGGAVNSPHLLMLSGIGPAAHLREHGIDVVADLAGVGQRLQDHPAVPMIWYTRGTTDLVEFSNVRGSLRLRSADPAWHPDIDAAYFDDGADLDAMLAGMKRLWEICGQGPLARYLETPWQLPTNPSDDDFVEHVRTHAQTLYHPVATCAMGSGEDSVVDADLRVRGVAGLRVVDASVMPAVPRGNTNAPTIMVAEKAADLIRSSR